MNIRRLVVSPRRGVRTLFITMVLVTASCSLASAQIRSDIQTLRKRFQTSMKVAADSALSSQRAFTDSVVSSDDGNIAAHSKALRRFTDSLIVAARDSLNASRKDSVRQLEAWFERNLTDFTRPHRQTAMSLLSDFQQAMHGIQRGHADCQTCTEAKDFQDELTGLRQGAETLSALFRDSVKSLSADWQEVLADSAETLRDSIGSFVQELIDNQETEKEAHEKPPSRFVVGVSYESHSSYRGRDNGVQQYFFSPSLGYHHSSGFSITFSMSWLNKTSNHWDSADLDIGYYLSFTKALDGYISYKHFWFGDSSLLNRATNNNNLGANLSYEMTVATLSFDVSVDFGKRSESTLSFGVSHLWESNHGIFGGSMDFEPSFTAVYGQQDEELIQVRKRRSLGKVASQKGARTSSVFGIMDYELSLPMTFRFNTFSFQPAVTYVVPLNVLDNSKTEPFFNIGAEVKFTLK